MSGELQHISYTGHKRVCFIWILPAHISFKLGFTLFFIIICYALFLSEIHSDGIKFIIYWCGFHSVFLQTRTNIALLNKIE